MPVTVQCPQCSRNLNVPDAMLGQQGRCPSCNHVFPLADSSVQVATALSPAPPPAASYSYPQNDYGSGGGNTFQDFHSGREAIYTPPNTFKKLYFWYIGVEVAWVLSLVALFMVTFIVAAVSEPPPPNPTFQRVGGKLNNDGFTANSRVTRKSSDDMAALIMLPFMGLGFLLVFAWVALYHTIIYKAWALIQDGNPRTTPGQAVGFCFIPLFNFYWWFVAIRGLSEDLNGYARRRNIHIREASVGLSTAYVIMRILTCVPCLNYMALIPMIILDLINLNSIRNAAADIATAKAG